MTSLHYWLWLEGLKGIGRKSKMLALDYFGTPENIYHAGVHDLRMLTGLSQKDIQALENKDIDNISLILDECSNKYIDILTPQDTKYPERLKVISDAPLVLYYKGKLPLFDDEVAIAVVGARKSSPYGQLMAKKLGYQIASCGGLVVSGLAEGTDARAHEGALTAGAATVAVLGNGIDVVYPYSNRFLYKDIEVMGALISEYPPGTEPFGSNFPVRNRILSALCLGTVVVEAPLKSGSLITANYALEQGRDVFAVPGSAGSASCEGSNKLIKDGAKLVENGWDIVVEYELRYPDKIRYKAGRAKIEDTMTAAVTVVEKPAGKAEPSKADKTPSDKKGIDNAPDKAYSLREEIKTLSPDERAIIECLMDKQRHVDDIIDMTQLPASRVLAMLTLLEIRGLVQQMPGKRFKIKE